jgi:hypothetical protein
VKSIRGIRGGTHILLLGAVAAAVVLMVVGHALFRRDEAELWSDIQKEFAVSPILSVELRADGPEQMTLTGVDAEAFSKALLAATFSEGNPDNYGPTPAVLASFDYTGHERFGANQWPDGRFELRWDERQFLVSSPELAALLREKGFVYQ